MKRDANDVAAEGGIDELRRQTELRSRIALNDAARKYPTANELFNIHRGRLRDSVIDGIVRAGEIVTTCAPPKAGKSWLAYHFACAVAAGWPVLGLPQFETTQGLSVIIDNELHIETIASRVPIVREALGMPPIVQDYIRVKALRGDDVDIDSLGEVFAEIKAFEPRFVILDALYRFLPQGVSENDNAAMTQIYNKLNKYAKMLGNTAIMVIHHSSKGGQGEKDVMDVGAGAGAIGRATDFHLVIREHDEPEHFVIEGKARTWRRPDAFVAHWKHPLWTPTSADAKGIKGKKPEKTQTAAPPKAGDDSAFLVVLDHTWKTYGNIVSELQKELMLTNNNAKNFVASIITKNGLHGLRQQDGIRDCGGFEVQKENTWLFRLKITPESMAIENL